MKRLINLLLMGLLMTLFGCGKKKLLTDNEIKICQGISFDQELAELIKGNTKQNIQQTPGISELGEILDSNGIGLCSQVDENAGFDFVIKEKERFRNKGYLLFVFENDKSQKFIGSIKGVDELDIIKWRQTNGVNYDHENKDIIAKLQLWKQKNDFIIVGASMDWIQLQFNTMPNDIESFAKDVYEFCPDAIDQGAGDMPTLIKMIKEMNGLYLWWD